MKASVSVICYKYKTLSNGENTLMLRVSKDGKCAYKSLDISIQSKHLLQYVLTTCCDLNDDSLPCLPGKRLVYDTIMPIATNGILKCADEGLAVAQELACELYTRGIGVESDTEKAGRYLHHAVYCDCVDALRLTDIQRYDAFISRVLPMFLSVLIDRNEALVTLIGALDLELDYVECNTDSLMM